MKILHVEDNFLPSAGYQLNFLAKWQVRLGHQVSILTSDSLAPWESNGFFSGQVEDLDKQYQEDFGVNIFRIKSQIRVSGREFLGKELFELATKENPDIVMIHGFDTLTGIKFINRIESFPFPLIADSHMVGIASQNRFRKLFRWYFKKYLTPKITRFNLKVVAVSEATKDFMIQAYNIPENNIPIIPLGTDTELFKLNPDSSETARKQLGIPNDAYVIVYSGKITQDKKVILLVESFKRIAMKYPQRAFLILIGGGSGNYYQNVFEKLEPVNEYVRFVPTQEVWNLPQYYQSANIAVWPGACSLSFFDAQACGLPVIAEYIDANVERLSFGNGWLFQSDSVQDLTEKIEQSMQTPKELLKEIGEKGREKVLEKHSYKKIAQDFEKLMLKEINKFNFLR